MKKFTPLLIAALLLLTAGCAGGTTGSSNSGSTSAKEQAYTGILDQIKDDTIVVMPENDDSTIYTFDTEGITVDAKLGDKVTVTYTGDINDAESLLKASKVETVK